jgi:hypothetical protein
VGRRPMGGKGVGGKGARKAIDRVLACGIFRRLAVRQVRPAGSQEHFDTSADRRLGARETPTERTSGWLTLTIRSNILEGLPRS